MQRDRTRKWFWKTIAHCAICEQFPYTDSSTIIAWHGGSRVENIAQGTHNGSWLEIGQLHAHTSQRMHIRATKMQANAHAGLQMQRTNSMGNEDDEDVERTQVEEEESLTTHHQVFVHVCSCVVSCILL